MPPPGAHRTLATLRAEQPSEAIALVRTEIALFPDDAAAHRLLGEVRAEQGSTNEALQHLGQALRLQPVDFRAHTLLAELVAERGDKELAAKHFNTAMDINPDHTRAHHGAVSNASKTKDLPVSTSVDFSVDLWTRSARKETTSPSVSRRSKRLSSIAKSGQAKALLLPLNASF